MTVIVGQQFRQYRINAMIGEGGMGVVYRAHDVQLGRDVALKFITHAAHGGGATAERLRREARALAALQHPNIVTIHGIDDLDGTPFLILEWIDGTPLDDPSIASPMPVEAFLVIGRDVAAALHRAHDYGIVHRDLKPANVLRTADGHAKLLDFGVARRDEGNASALTAVDTAIGTVSYMSPEQANGEAVGPASDVFSFGVLAYELLSGVLPFAGPSVAAQMFAIVTGRHIPLGEHRPDLPVALVDLIERCLANDPEHRPSDGRALLEGLTGPGLESNSPATRQVSSSSPDSQSIRFCRTADGLQIAYALVGSGPPLVRVLGHFTHLEMEWSWPELRLMWEELARSNTVVRYDGRGIGLSDPWQGEFTEETRQLDLDAVISTLDSGPVSLLGISEGGWTAAAYASDHPEQVASLILYGAYCRGAEARPSHDAEEDEALITLIRKGWGRDTATFRQLFTSRFFQDDTDPRLLAHFNELQRVSADPDTAARYHASCHRRGDGSAMFASVTAPTLVVHGKQDEVTDVAEGRLLASVIPDARLVLLPGYGHYFPVDRPGVGRVVETFNGFLHPGK